MDLSTLSRAKQIQDDIKKTDYVIAHFTNQEGEPKFDAKNSIEHLTNFLNNCGNLSAPVPKGEIALEMLTKFLEDLKAIKKALENEFEAL